MFAFSLFHHDTKPIHRVAQQHFRVVKVRSLEDEVFVSCYYNQHHFCYHEGRRR